MLSYDGLGNFLDIVLLILDFLPQCGFLVSIVI